MKKLMLVTMLAVATTAFADMKIGTVDLMKLVRNHPNYESNRKILSTTEKNYGKEIDSLKLELEKVQTEGKKQSEQLRNPMLSAAKKAELEKSLLSIQEKFMNGQQELRNKALKSQDELQKLENTLLKATTDEIREKITDYAKANGYDFIVDANAMPYVKAEYDVTPAIQKAIEDANKTKEK